MYGRGSKVKIRAWLTALLLALPLAATADQVWLLDIDDAIGPATADYVVRGLDDAAAAGAELVVLRIDTPGGLDLSMRDIVKAILAADVPVVSWVAPGGARAASAGTYILYASHIAAMAPATNLGSATPVQLGAPGLPDLGAPQEVPSKDGAEEPPAAEGPPPAAAPGSAMERKVLNDAIAYIRGLAELRGRNADWAEAAVREAANLSAADALAQHVIDLVARDQADLLAQLHGRPVNLADGRTKTLDTAGSEVQVLVPDWRNRFLATITNPNIAYILMLVGIYGLILEFYNPGGLVPGVVGAICLLLALYAMQVLPVSYAGLGLVLLGVVLMAAEAMVPSFGALGIGGVIAFVIGSVILMDTSLPAFRIALPLVAAVSAVSAGLLVFVLGLVVRARRQAVVSGVGTMVGRRAVALQAFAREGPVRVGGEIWHGRSAGPVSEGEELRVTGVEGLTVEVVGEQTQTEEETT